MRTSIRLGLPLAAIMLTGLMAAAQPRLEKSVLTMAPQKPSALVGQADAIVAAKVTELEADTVEAPPYKGADQKTSYKIAVLKVDEALLGAGGLTRFRVGFPADAPATAPPGDGPPVTRVRRPGRPQMAVALTAGQEGCFCLSRHPTADFYILSGPPLAKADDKFAAEVEKVKKAAKAIGDPVAALKAKDLDDRFQAAQVILQRYQRNPGGIVSREPIPVEENKLIVALLAELPWMPDSSKPAAPGEVGPNRNSLWHLINPVELGFAQPNFQPQPGNQQVDYNKVMDEASSKFLKENGEKIKIKRVVQK